MSWDATRRPVTELNTPRLLLRQWQARDLEPFAAMNADPRVMAHFERPQARGESDRGAERIRRALADRGWGLWAVERLEDGRFLGFVGLQPVPEDLPFAPALEVGWRLVPDAWGQGLAPEAARASLAFAFGVLAADEVVAMTSARNTKSRRVMDKLGMTRDPADDFAHPRMPEGHPERSCVLYRLPGSRWRRQAGSDPDVAGQAG